MQYKIHLEGKLEPSFQSWFEDMQLVCENGRTILKGELVDQPALHGLLKRIRDLGLTIIKVERLDAAL